MSDYFDILKSAMEKGILLDSCGTDERQYWNGLYNDLCGMSVEDALEVQYWHGSITPSKKENVITFEMRASGSSYELVLNPSFSTAADVTASFILDEEQHTVVIPSGSLSFSTGIIKATKYASLKNIALSSEDETYIYTSNNKVKTGDFTLTYISATGEIISTESVRYGTTVTIPGVPSEYQVGYDYYWHLQGSETPISGTFVMPEENVTIVGKATIHTWTITYKIYGEADVVKSYNYGEAVIKYIPSEKEGYEFSGWDDVEPSTMPDYDLIFNGTYNILSYTLNYVIEGTLYSSLTYEYNEVITPIDSPEKEGYTFSGWNEMPEKMPSHDVTVYGVYTINTYTITYHIDGLEDVVKTYEFQETVVKYTPIMEGHTFSGWNEEEPEKMPARNIVLNGTFTANVYTITYYVDGEIYLSEEHNFGAEITIINEPEKEGYTFSGWDEELPKTMPSHNIEIHGAYTINSHNVIFYVDDIEFFRKTLNYGEVVEPIAYPEKEGYTFGGWSDFPSEMPDYDVEIYGYFAINSYTLTYYLDDYPYSSFTYEYGAEIVAIDEPEKEGYTFSKWTDVPATMPAHDVDVHGYFTINKYILTYFVDGEKYAEKEYEYLSPITPIDEPEKEGYTFSGWDKEVPAAMPAYDVTIEGSFSINTYTLTYIVDEEIYSSETYEYHSAVVPIEAPYKEGHTFVKWNGIPSKMPAKDCIVIATYSINEWVITYTIEGEGVYTSITYQYGATIVDPVPPSRSGYTFAWEEHTETMPDHNLNISGKYSEITTSKDIYYGVFPYSSITETTAEQILSCQHIDGTLEKNKVIFTLPYSPEYTEMENKYNEGEITLKQWKNWLSAHNYAFTIASPYEKVSSIVLADDYDNNFELTQEKEMTINNTRYALLDWTDISGTPLEYPLVQGPEDVNYNMVIKIN